MENQPQQTQVQRMSQKKKIIIIAVSIFFLFFIFGYVSGTMVSHEEKWFGAGPTFWDALKPF